VGGSASPDAEAEAVAGVEAFTFGFVFEFTVMGERSMENLLISNVLADVSRESGGEPSEGLSGLPAVFDALIFGIFPVSLALLRSINRIQAPFFPSLLLFFSHEESPIWCWFLKRFLRLEHQNMRHRIRPTPRTTAVTMIPISDPDMVPASLSLQNCSLLVEIKETKYTNRGIKDAISVNVL
jgi:hypothetical protein